MHIHLTVYGRCAHTLTFTRGEPSALQQRQYNKHAEDIKKKKVCKVEFWCTCNILFRLLFPVRILHVHMVVCEIHNIKSGSKSNISHHMSTKQSLRKMRKLKLCFLIFKMTSISFAYTTFLYLLLS